MKSIVRRDTGEDWQEYVKRLMLEAGEIEEDDEPSAKEIARSDRKRKDKKVSNLEWQSQTDPSSRITKMKDPRTHLAYKAEHVIDLETELILADKGYYGNETLSDLEFTEGLRTYVAEPKQTLTPSTALFNRKALYYWTGVYSQFPSSRSFSRFTSSDFMPPHCLSQRSSVDSLTSKD